MTDATEQLSIIWNVISPVVEQRIQASGGFSPLGATLQAGRVQAVVPASVADAAGLLRAHLRTLAASGLYDAVGMASQVEAAVADSDTPVQGILYQFDSASGVSQATFLPYSVDAGGQISYGELYGQEGDHGVFPKPQTAPES